MGIITQTWCKTISNKIIRASQAISTKITLTCSLIAKQTFAPFRSTMKETTKPKQLSLTLGQSSHAISWHSKAFREAANSKIHLKKCYAFSISWLWRFKNLHRTTNIYACKSIWIRVAPLLIHLWPRVQYKSSKKRDSQLKRRIKKNCPRSRLTV